MAIKHFMIIVTILLFGSVWLALCVCGGGEGGLSVEFDFIHPTSVPTEVRIVGFCPHRSSFHVLSPFKCHSHSWGKERGSTGESVEPRHTQKHATIELLSPQKLLLKQGKIQTEFGTGILQLWKKHLGGVFVACGLDKGKNKRFGIGTHIYSF